MNSQAVVLEKHENGEAWVTINQPEAMNALTQPVLDDLLRIARETNADDTVKVIVLTGAGRAFCAGGDIKRFSEGFAPEEGVSYLEGIHEVVRAWVGLKKPVIAAVNGAAMGAGMSLMLLCDLVYAADNAKMGCAFVNMALVPDCGLAYFLPRIVGLQCAKELVFSGRTVTAQEAKELGIVSAVFASDELHSQVMTIASKLAAGPPLALRYAKRLIDAGNEMDFNTLLHMESVVQGRMTQTEDAKEAVDAFLNKRRPVFRGL